MTASPHTRVLLVGSANLQSLAVGRTLGSQGVEVHVASTRRTPSATSRYVRWAGRHPDPFAERSQFVEWTNATCARLHIDAVVPMDDESSIVLAEEVEHRNPHFTVAAPRADLIRLSFDKVALAVAADQAGVATPASHVVRDINQVAPLVRRYGSVVAKSRLAIGPSSDGTLVRGGRVWICRTVDEAVDAVATIVNAEGEALLQAKVEGEEYGLGLVRAENGGLVVVVTRRVRSWPPSGGSPSLLRTAIAPDGLVQPLARLLEQLRWTGVAQADVLWSAGRPVLLDLNPRIWATVGSSITAGVDVPSAVLAAAHGGQLRAVSPVPDAGWAEADTELRHLACLLADRRGVRRPGESLSGALRRLRKDFRPPIEINPLSSRDPLPAVGYLLWAMPATLFRNNRARRRGRRRARHRGKDATLSSVRAEHADSQ